MVRSKIDELKLIELKELVNKTVFEMKERYPETTMADLQKIARFSGMLYKNIQKEHFNKE